MVNLEKRVEKLEIEKRLNLEESVRKESSWRKG